MAFEFDGLEFSSAEARANFISMDTFAQKEWRDKHAPMKPPLGITVRYFPGGRLLWGFRFTRTLEGKTEVAEGGRGMFAIHRFDAYADVDIVREHGPGPTSMAELERSCGPAFTPAETKIRVRENWPDYERTCEAMRARQRKRNGAILESGGVA